MNELAKALLIYVIGGVTFIPLALVFVIYLSSSPLCQQHINTEPKPNVNAYSQHGKKGWIRLTKQYKRRVSYVMAMYVQSTKRLKEHVFVELKGGALFIYNDERQEDCLFIIPVHNYQVSVYSPKEHCPDHDIFGKSTAIQLTPNDIDKEEDIVPDQLSTKDTLFITCARSVDKEDWYFGLLASTHMMKQTHIEMIDTTQFDPSAMEMLMNTMQQDASYREIQWLNAILGRLFLSLYKTNEMKAYFQAKISKKVQKIKFPSYLGEVVVTNVDMGHSIPFITQPKLLSLTLEGDLLAEAVVNYTGGLRVVIQTDLSWMKLVLSVTLKQLSGKIVVKVKPPPTNRYWIGFETLPVMDWEIVPIVSDKQIRIAMITNAIQSKIREFMMENIVLPNMEDIAFCPSDGLGGIFGERIPKPSTPPTSPKIVPESGIQFDMLGNKVNKRVVAPKIIVSMEGEEEYGEEGDRKRAQSVCEMLPSRSPATSKLRRYSNPMKISLFSSSLRP